MKTYITFILLFSCTALRSQNIYSVIANIDKNNNTLKALREQVEADKIEIETNNTLANPQIEFNYLWGTSNEEAYRYDINVSQTFDFPTIYYYRKQLAKGKKKLLDIRYNLQRFKILQEASELYVTILYHNTHKQLNKKRLALYKQAYNATRISYEKGNSTILEYNKSKLYVLNTEKSIKKDSIETETTKRKLANLNGNIELFISDTIMLDIPTITTDFNKWHECTTLTEILNSMVNVEKYINEKQIKLAKSERLPGITTGYISERTNNSTLQGIEFSLSLPLWGNGNKIKHAISNAIVSKITNENFINDFKCSIINEFEIMVNNYKTVIDLSSTEKDIENSVTKIQTAYTSGEINIYAYSEQMDNYYKYIEEYFQILYELSISYSRMKCYEL